MNAGIYQIRCKSNNKIYIGSSIELQRRIWHHQSCLRNGTHKNMHLQHAWDKYGEEDFEFTILEIIEDGDILEVEQSYLDSFDFTMLFNINPFATGGTQFSQDMIDRRSKSIAKVHKLRSKRYNLWKEGNLTDITEIEIKVFNNWSTHTPWNKGLTYKFPPGSYITGDKRKPSDKTNFKIRSCEKFPQIKVFDINMNFLNEFNCAREIQRLSETDSLNLPTKSRFKRERMGKALGFLSSCNINKACKTGKPYKGLYFQYSPLSEQSDNVQSVNSVEVLNSKDNTEPSLSGNTLEGVETRK